MMKSILATLLLVWFTVGNCMAESLKPDTVPAVKEEVKKDRNFHYNILGGPSFSPDFGLLVGGSALMTFRMNPSDVEQKRSVVPIAIAFMFKGGLNLISKPQLFFGKDNFLNFRSVFL